MSLASLCYPFSTYEGWGRDGALHSASPNTTFPNRALVVSPGIRTVSQEKIGKKTCAGQQEAARILQRLLAPFTRRSACFLLVAFQMDFSSWIRTALLRKNKSDQSNPSSSQTEPNLKQREVKEAEEEEELGVTDELKDFVKSLSAETFKNFPLQQGIKISSITSTKYTISLQNSIIKKYDLIDLMQMIIGLELLTGLIIYRKISVNGKNVMLCLFLLKSRYCDLCYALKLVL